jgi:hypothetical protein
MKWLYDSGYSTQQIGDRFSCSRENVRRIFKLRGWQLRQNRIAVNNFKAT